MQNQVNTHPPTPKKTREVGGIAVGPKDVQSLYPGVALCPTHIRKAQKYTGNKGTEVAHRWHKENGGYPWVPIYRYPYRYHLYTCHMAWHGEHGRYP